MQNPVQLAGDFASLSGSFGAPFAQREYMGRVDLNIKTGWTFFAKFTYDQNFSVRGFNPGVYQPFENVDHTPDYAVGTDFTSGRFTHSIRFGYLKFRNGIVSSSGIFNPAPGIAINITPSSGDVTCLAGGEGFCSGTNILAPQNTFQSDKQMKYDGSYTIGNHVIRYGVGYNKNSWRRLRQVLRSRSVGVVGPKRRRRGLCELLAQQWLHHSIRAGRRNKPAQLASQHGHHGQRPGFLHGNPAVRSSGRRTV